MKIYNIFALLACVLLVSCPSSCVDEYTHITVTNTRTQSVYFTIYQDSWGIGVNDLRADVSKTIFSYLEPNSKMVFDRYEEYLMDYGFSLVVVSSATMEQFDPYEDFPLEKYCDSIIIAKYDDLVKWNFKIDI